MDGGLQFAIWAGDLPRVRQLVEGGASITETKGSLSPLNLAAYHGKQLIVHWLLAEGGAHISDVDSRGFTALLSAACKTLPGSPATVQWIL
jgi:ankyrin repeat protein